MQAALPSKFQSGILASPRQQARFLRLDRCVAAYLSLSALVWHRLRQGRTRRLGVRCAQGQNPGARCLSRPAEGPVRRESETNSAKLRRQSSGSGALSQSGREQNARPAEAAGSAGTPLNGASAGRLQRVSLALGARVQGRLGGGGWVGRGLVLVHSSTTAESSGQAPRRVRGRALGAVRRRWCWDGGTRLLVALCKHGARLASHALLRLAQRESSQIATWEPKSTDVAVSRLGQLSRKRNYTRQTRS